MNRLRPELNMAQGLVVELIGTMILVLLVLAISDPDPKKDFEVCKFFLKLNIFPITLTAAKILTKQRQFFKFTFSCCLSKKNQNPGALQNTAKIISFAKNNELSSNRASFKIENRSCSATKKNR